MPSQHLEEFPKPPLTFEQQVQLLKKRGLIIEDENFAEKVLTYLNYYRLSGYTLSLRTNDNFHPGITFDLVYKIYELDRKLRYLLLDIIEVVEIAFRTHIAYYLAHNYGPLSYQESSFFENDSYHAEFIKELQEQIERNKKKELFVDHHLNKYGGKFPIWVAVELFSFGMLSKFFSNMKSKDRDTISEQYYGFSSVYTISWLYSLVTLRNICAHYSRIYNRIFTITPRLGRKDKKLGLQNNRLFVFIFVLKYLIKDKNRWTIFLTNLKEVIEEYKDVDISLIGFPDNWYELLE